MNVEVAGRTYQSIEQMREREDAILRAVRNCVSDAEHAKLNDEWAELSYARLDADGSHDRRAEEIRSAAGRAANREGPRDTSLTHEHALATDSGPFSEARQQGLRAIERMAP